MSPSRAENQDIAQRLREGADLLEAQGANPFRVGAYRKAAEAIAAHPRALREIFEAEGLPGLDAIAHVGPGIAAAIAEMLASGSWSQLDRLRGTIDAVRLFRTIPGVGAQLAERLHEALGADSNYILADGFWSMDLPYPGAKELGERYMKDKGKGSVVVGMFYANAQVLLKAIE